MKRVAESINQVIIAIASIRAGFILAVTGAIAQTFHTYFIGFAFSSFSGVAQVIQAVIVAIFFSGGLLFYTVRSGNAENYSDKERYNNIATYFMVFEIFINLYYWLDKIIFQPIFIFHQPWSDVLLYKLIIAIPFSIAIPVILKQYAGEINIREILASVNGGANDAANDAANEQLVAKMVDDKFYIDEK